jgi:hypothetical protein
MVMADVEEVSVFICWADELVTFNLEPVAPTLVNLLVRYKWRNSAV